MDDEDFSKLPREDLRAIWKDLFCSFLNSRKADISDDNIKERMSFYGRMADVALEEYMSRHTKFRELALKAFK